MQRVFSLFLCVILFVLAFGPVLPAAAKGDTGYQTGFQLWQGSAGEFSAWEKNATTLAASGALVLDPSTAHPGTDSYAPGTYYGGNYYNGGSYVYGEAISPELPVNFDFSEAIASWNAETPDGTWIETQARARMGTRWTKWYSLGVWAADDSPIQRHSVRAQGDADGTVYTDTLALVKGKVPAEALQVKVILYSDTGANVPSVRSLSLAYSTPAPKKAALSTGDPALWNTLLDVPECSQMVYPDGGNVWCSPTSVSMVLGYWGIDPGPCEQRVRAAVAGVYDWVYDGHGNWPFNTAYAASRGLEGYVARYPSLAALEPWVKSGVPVVLSIAWGKKDLTGAAIPSSSGHLVVLVGFDAQGNPIVNDPAAASDTDVQRTYLRSELETVWQEASGGTVYLIFPQGYSTPGF